MPAKTPAPIAADPLDEDLRELWIGRDWRILDITRAAAAWSDSTPEALVGKDSRTAWPVPPVLLDAIDESFRSGQPSVVQFPSVIAPGRWVEFRARPNADGARISFEDVTARHEAAKGPPPAWAPASDAGPAEIAVLDRAGRIVSGNAAWHLAFAAHGLQVPKGGVGFDYVAISMLAKPDLDETGLRNDLADLFAGRVTQFHAAYEIGTPPNQRPRQVKITPITIGGVTYFVAVHEDLAQRVRLGADLRRTSSELLDAQERERARIALEIHDSLSQHLVAASLGMMRLRQRLGDDPDIAAILDETSASVREAIHETRTISYVMKPNAVADEGLAGSARRFAKGFELRVGLKTNFSAEGPVDAAHPDLQHAMFRVIQESLSNVHRHADATHVDVRICARDGQLTTSIRDDGKGISGARSGGVEQAQLGVGIHGMRARMEQLGGTLLISSGADGTLVTAQAPTGG
jgi:signal transduction histidine kinase